MIRQCFLTNSGIQFEADKLREIAGIDPEMLYPIVTPRPPPLEIPHDLANLIELRNYAKSGKVGGEIEKGGKAIVKVMGAEQKAVQRANSVEKVPSRSASLYGDGNEQSRDVDIESTASAPASIYDGGEDAVGDGEKKHHHPFVSEEEEDLFDALSPIYDQLKLAKPWWVLEFLPMKHRMQKEDGTWGRSYA